jgi:Tol biopolymer transport system component
MKSIRIFLILFFTALLAAACSRSQPNQEAPEAGPEDSLAQSLPQDAPPVSPFSGLIYSNEEGLWQINSEGASGKLADCAGKRLSVDGKNMVYMQEGEIFLINLENCTARNLTNSREQFNVNPQLWKAVPGVVFFGVNPELNSGAPATVNFDGSGLRVLDESAAPNGDLGFSPDGIRIAYPGPDGPRIYRWDTGDILELDLSQFGLDPSTVQRIDSPAWSPDSSKLAWVTGFQNGDDYATWRIGILVLDFDTMTYVVIHPYIPVGRGGWPPHPVWSPDGRWLAYNVWSEDPGASGMYVASADGSQIVHLEVPNPHNNWLTQGFPPLWSPDGRILVFSIWLDENVVYYANASDWLPAPLPLPGAGVPVDWR